MHSTKHRRVGHHGRHYNLIILALVLLLSTTFLFVPSSSQRTPGGGEPPVVRPPSTSNNNNNSNNNNTNALPIGIILVSAMAGTVILLYIGLKCHDPRSTHFDVIIFALAIIDFISDCIFIYTIKDNKTVETVFYLAVVFTCVPFIMNMLSLLYIIWSEMSNTLFRQWVKEHTAIFTGITLIASTNIDAMFILDSRVCCISSLPAPWSDEMRYRIRIFGFITIGFEDIPQAALQIYVISTNQYEIVSIITLCTSLLNIIFGIIKRVLVCYVYHWDKRHQHTEDTPLDTEGEVEDPFRTAKKFVAPPTPSRNQKMLMIKGVGEIEKPSLSTAKSASSLMPDSVNTKSISTPSVQSCLPSAPTPLNFAAANHAPSTTPHPPVVIRSVVSEPLTSHTLTPNAPSSDSKPTTSITRVTLSPAGVYKIGSHYPSAMPLAPSKSSIISYPSDSYPTTSQLSKGLVSQPSSASSNLQPTLVRRESDISPAGPSTIISFTPTVHQSHSLPSVTASPPTSSVNESVTLSTYPSSSSISSTSSCSFSSSHHPAPSSTAKVPPPIPFHSRPRSNSASPCAVNVTPPPNRPPPPSRPTVNGTKSNMHSGDATKLSAISLSQSTVPTTIPRGNGLTSSLAAPPSSSGTSSSLSAASSSPPLPPRPIHLSNRPIQ